MLFWGCALSSKAQDSKPGIKPAQYRFLSPGEPMPYLGVAVGLETYRAEGFKLKKQTQLIDSLKKELQGVKLELFAAKKESVKQAESKGIQTQLASSAQAATSEVKIALQETQEAYKRAKPRWYESPIFIGAVSFVGGVYIGAKVTK